MSENKINISLSTDDNYFNYAFVTIASIVKSSSIDNQYNIIILEQRIDEIKKQTLIDWISDYPNFNVEFINMDNYEHIVTNYKKLNNLSNAAYYRLFLHEVLKDFEKILYLDCDLIVRKDISELYNTDISNYCLAGVKDDGVLYYFSKMPEFIEYMTNIGLSDYNNYFNSGVLLMNLELIRNGNYSERLLEIAIKNDQFFNDQNVLNVVFEGNVLYVDDKWNYQASNGEIVMQRGYNMDESFIIHFCASDKPWKNNYDDERLFDYLWWDVASTLPIYKELRLHQKEYEKIKSNEPKKISKFKKLRYNILSKITFGKMRKKYKEKYKKIIGK